MERFTRESPDGALPVGAPARPIGQSKVVLSRELAGERLEELDEVLLILLRHLFFSQGLEHRRQVGVVLAIPGQGFLMTNLPSSPAFTSLPLSSTTATSFPKNGFVAEPGFSGVIGRGVIINPPVSVCHQVSMIGHFS